MITCLRTPMPLLFHCVNNKEGTLHVCKQYTHLGTIIHNKACEYYIIGLRRRNHSRTAFPWYAKVMLITRNILEKHIVLDSDTSNNLRRGIYLG